jgi:transcriptional regulator with XRE-family HTH domain
MAVSGAAGALTASSGIPALDEALGGLYWGDNVVWQADEDAPVDAFYRAVAGTASEYQLAAFVSLTIDPAELEQSYPGFTVIDARPDSPLARPEALLAEIGRRCSPVERDLILFEAMESMTERWGMEQALRFFSKTCPHLLELGAIAYWSFVPSHQPRQLRRELEEITQCVFALGDDRLRISKAEGRPAGVQGTVFRYRLDDGKPELTVAPAAARLGAALLAFRLNRDLSQSDLARLAGVSPSAISQAERGQRGLSLETLLTLTARLEITLDELLRGDVAPGYRLGRRHDPLELAESKLLPLLDNPEAGLRAYVVRLPPGGSGSPGVSHKGVEAVAVASGLVQVVLPTGRPVLRAGETLLAERSGVASWRNLSDHEAMLFWILRDDMRAVEIQ